eukprot:m.205829 g.205829  ORF g.205829 m.205829 type:complete len:387 (+) comp23083_c0_seq1:191-1351(+)
MTRLNDAWVSAVAVAVMAGMLTTVSGEVCTVANPPGTMLWWVTLRGTLDSPVATLSNPVTALDATSLPMIVPAKTAFNVTLHRQHAANSSTVTIHTVKLALGRVNLGGTITAMGNVEFVYMGGAAINVGTIYPGVEVVGYGNDAGLVCRDGQSVATGTGTVPTAVTSAPVPPGTECISRVGVACGVGCCRGLVCGTASVGAPATCQIPTPSPTIPRVVGATDDDDDETVEDETPTKRATYSTTDSTDKAMVTLIAGVALIVIGLSVAVILAYRYNRSGDGETSEYDSEVPLHTPRYLAAASIDDDYGTDGDYQTCSSVSATPPVRHHGALVRAKQTGDVVFNGGRRQSVASERTTLEYGGGVLIMDLHADQPDTGRSRITRDVTLV